MEPGKWNRRGDNVQLYTEHLGHVHTVPDSEMEQLQKLPDKASVHTRNTTFGTISALEQDHFAPF